MTRSRTRPSAKRRLTRIYVVVSIAILLALIVLVPQRGSLTEALRSLRYADAGLLSLGVVLTFLTFLAASGAYTALALHPLRYWRVVMIQLSSGFATKLLPAGAGGAALNIRFLQKHQHTLVQAGSVVALNNLIGFVGHMMILFAAVVFASAGFRSGITIHMPSYALPLLICLLAAAGLLLIAVPVLKSRVLRLLLGIAQTLSLYQKRPRRLLAGFVCASCVTALYAGVLFITARSLGADLSVLQTLLIFSTGVIGAAITPTPGGIGGAEAALTAALVATGIPTPTALSIALGYRLLTYWLPILPGFFLFHYASRKGYI